MLGINISHLSFQILIIYFIIKVSRDYSFLSISFPFVHDMLYHRF